MKQLEIQATSVGCEIHDTLKAITKLLEKTHAITKDKERMQHAKM